MGRDDAQQAREEAAAKLTQEMLQKFEEDWRPAVENLEEAALAFDDLEGPPPLTHRMACLGGFQIEGS